MANLPAISRRQFLATTTAATAATCLHPRSLWASQVPAAQQPTDFLTKARSANVNNKITTTPLRRNVTALLGAGGNIAVLTAKEGKLVVDSGYSSCQPQLTAALGAINAQPIQVLINTQNIVAYNAIIPPAPTGALPTILVNTNRKLSDSINTLMLTHYEPAHTDTDISVHFAEADILHCGDTFWNGFYPFIDYSSGGNINGMIAATEKNLATAGADTIIIPGHGPIGNKAQLTEFRDMLVGARDNVAKLKKEGKSLDETIAAKPTANYDAKWGQKPAAFIGYVYQGV
jgi:glyoxylase-like metal-dependent hydrolase (beta-lactamase superfamily II)